MNENEADLIQLNSASNKNQVKFVAKTKTAGNVIVQFL